MVILSVTKETVTKRVDQTPCIIIILWGVRSYIFHLMIKNHRLHMDKMRFSKGGGKVDATMTGI
ncbi:MAG: hypothetical protein ACM3X1_04805 [Ignavibacteriales bacterium]